MLLLIQNKKKNKLSYRGNQLFRKVEGRLQVELTTLMDSFQAQIPHNFLKRNYFSVNRLNQEKSQLNQKIKVKMC